MESLRKPHNPRDNQEKPVTTSENRVKPLNSSENNRTLQKIIGN
jgi:hypothetical protein